MVLIVGSEGQRSRSHSVKVSCVTTESPHFINIH